MKHIIKIDYNKFHQQLHSDNDLVIKAYKDFIKVLNENFYTVIAETEFGGTLNQVKITIDEFNKIKETKL